MLKYFVNMKGFLPNKFGHHALLIDILYTAMKKSTIILVYNETYMQQN